MCCCGLDASEKHSEREEKGERQKDGWRLSFLLSLCVSFWALPHTGADGIGESRNWEKEGENKPNFYSGTGNNRFS